MPSSTVLLTGSNGFVGFHVLLGALREGYKVRAVVRSEEKSKTISNHAKIQEANKNDQLTFIIIPDFSTPGVWDEPLRGAEYFVHVASQMPWPGLDPDVEVFQPNIKANTDLFKNLLAAPDLKRAIFTSSILATMAREPRPPGGGGPYGAHTVQPTPTGGPFRDEMDGYSAAKMHELNTGHALVREHNARFDLINIFPGYIFGRDERAKVPGDMFLSSNLLMAATLTGQTLPSRAGVASHIDDVAEMHVKALSPSIKGNQDYGVCVPMVWNDAVKFAKKHFPEAFQDGRLKEGDHENEVVEWDASPGAAAFGMKFKDYETQVVDVTTQYLELLAKEKKE